MNNAHIRVIQEEGIFFVATESERLQISNELAAKLAGKNQAQICGILRRDPEITGEKLSMTGRWCRIRTAQSHQGNLSDFLSQFTYQPALTTKLDALAGQPFSQEVVNEIVLWKVNRYAPPDAIQKALHTLGALDPERHRDGEHVLNELLACDGLDLPMASTFLRFQAPDVFQIIDRHAYRAAYGKAYPLYPASKPQAKIDTYFEYLDKLHQLARSSGAKFRDLDRILYVFDKDQNGKL